MATIATLSHPGSGMTLAACLIRFEAQDEVPEVVHTTAYRTRLRYLLGVSVRTASCGFRVRTEDDYDALRLFYQTAIASGTRFTFVPDEEFPDDEWSAVFTSPLAFSRLTEVTPPLVGEFSVQIEDAPVQVPI